METLFIVSAYIIALAMYAFVLASAYEGICKILSKHSK